MYDDIHLLYFHDCAGFDDLKDFEAAYKRIPGSLI